MIQRIKELSSYWNVSGFEFELASYLKTQLKEYDVSQSAQNSIYVKKQFSNPNILILVRLDIPGFILLDRNKDKSFYSTTEKTKSDNLKYSVISRDRKKFTIQIDENGIYSSKINHLKIGESIKEQFFLNEDIDYFNGKYISQYLIISFILSNIEKILSDKAAVLFYAQSHSNHKEILAYLSRHDFTHAILLDGILSDNNYPTILIKDRKAVTPYHLINRIRQNYQKSIIYSVSDEKITGAEEVLRSGVIPVPYLLPVIHLANKDERVSKKSFENFQTSFLTLIKHL